MSEGDRERAGTETDEETEREEAERVGDVLRDEGFVFSEIEREGIAEARADRAANTGERGGERGGECVVCACVCVLACVLVWLCVCEDRSCVRVRGDN